VNAYDAGKSTTIGMLVTTVAPTSGHAYVAGIDVAAHPAAAKRRIGVVPQANTLDRQLSVRDNLYYHGRFFGVGRREARRRASELLEQFALGDRARASVPELSGGMARRLLVARALMHRPDILFLDSRQRASTRRPGSTCGASWPACTPKGRPFCSPRTAWKRPTPSASGSRSSTTARSSRRAARPSSSRTSAPTRSSP
jgi:hypothetical protein